MSQQRRKSLFVEGNVPPNGLCLSSFVVVSNGSSILVGEATKPDIWVDRFFMAKQFAPRYVDSGKYVIPASHLAWYESPLEAAEKVLREQVRLPVPKSKIRLLDVQSHTNHYGRSGGEQKDPHWDICFVYRVNLSSRQAKRMKQPEWFKRFGFRPRSKLSPEDFTRGHGDVLEAAGVIGKTKNR